MLISFLFWSLENNKLLTYAGQWRDSACQMTLRYLSSIANHQARKLIDNNIVSSFKKVINFVVSFSFLPANWLFQAFVIVKNKLAPVDTCSSWIHSTLTTLRRHFIFKSIRGQTDKKTSVNLLNSYVLIFFL